MQSAFPTSSKIENGLFHQVNRWQSVTVNGVYSSLLWLSRSLSLAWQYCKRMFSSLVLPTEYAGISFSLQIHGKLDSGMLYTPAYVARIKAMVRGAMRAVTVPCSVPDLWASLHRLQQQEDKESAAGVGGDSLYSTVLAELIAGGDLKGTLSGGKTLWTPAVSARLATAGISVWSLPACRE